MIRTSILFVGCVVAFSFTMNPNWTRSAKAQEPTPHKSRTEDPVQEPAQTTDHDHATTIDDGTPDPRYQAPPQSSIPPFRKNRTLQPWTSELGGGGAGNSQPYQPKHPGKDPRREMRPNVGGSNAGGSIPNTPTRRGNAEPASPRALSPTAPRISYNKGIRTIKVKDGKRMIVIEENPYRGIKVEITRSYDPGKHNELKRKLPALTEYMEMFPDELDSHRIELSVNVVSTYVGQTPEELQEENLGAYNIYRRYTKEADAQEGKSKAQAGNGNSLTID